MTNVYTTESKYVQSDETYLKYKIHNCTMESMKCDHCKKIIHSLNQFLDIFVCNDCYHKLVSKVYYPNAMEA
jgi:ribosomal protein L37AE/L43A